MNYQQPTCLNKIIMTTQVDKPKQTQVMLQGPNSYTLLYPTRMYVQ